MRLTTYPHPVLGNGDDYIGCNFVFNYDEDYDQGNNLYIIKPIFDSVIPEIDHQIKRKTARYALSIDCMSTNKHELKICNPRGTEVIINLDHYYGEIIVRPLIIVVEDIEEFCSENFNDEFELESYNIKTGSLLGIGEPLYFAARHKLKSFQSYISISKSDEVREYAYIIDLDNKINVSLGGKLYSLWSDLQNREEFNLLAWTVTKDIIHACLKEMTNGTEEAEPDWALSLRKLLSGKTYLLDDDEYDFNQINEIALSIISEYTIEKVKFND